MTLKKKKKKNHSAILHSLGPDYNKPCTGIKTKCELLPLSDAVRADAESKRLQQRTQGNSGILLPALMAGAFLLPSLSPEDGIPVVHAGSCSPAPHCNESSTDVFLLRLLLTLPLLLFSPACLQLRCSSFLNMSSTIAPLFFPPNLCPLFFESFLLTTCVTVYTCSYCQSNNLRNNIQKNQILITICFQASLILQIK